MKKICLVVFVYGEEYQGYIPLYLYSVFKNYPDYDVRVYVDRKLNDNIKNQIAIIEEMGNFKIIENFGVENLEINKKILNKNHIRKFRWLIFEEDFFNYESIYMGDIDIIICKENLGIFEQHKKHCDLINLSYSNCRRIGKQKIPKNIKFILYSLYCNGIKETIKLYKKEIYYNKLTGLHFVLTKPYYNIFNKAKRQFFLEKLRKQIENNEFMIGIDDEIFLFDMINESNLGLPEICQNGPINDPDLYSNIGFRPHHGIHLGIFRHEKIIESQLQTLNSSLYKKYYNQIKKYRENDERFRQIEKNNTNFVKSIMERMDLFYENV